jgi:hypothetical protein
VWSTGKANDRASAAIHSSKENAVLRIIPAKHPTCASAGGRKSRRRLVSVCGALLAAVALSAAAAPAANAGAGCPPSHACVWSLSNYGGAKQDFAAGDAGRLVFFAQPNRALKNHYENRAVWWYDGYYIWCLDAGASRPSVTVLALYITPPGTRC